MKKQRFLLLVLTIILTLGITPTVFADGPIAGRAGRAELRFLEGMIDHHQLALVMAKDCLLKAKAKYLPKLCNDIISAQTAEIKQMQDWLMAWYKVDYKTMPMAATPAMDGSDPVGMMGMMAGFNRLTGRDYELALLESMIDHHDDAVHMSQRFLKIGQHKDLLDFAQKIIDAQTFEIKAMETIIREVIK
jgi:uncharacterized protein (DUF305 family)